MSNSLKKKYLKTREFEKTSSLTRGSDNGGLKQSMTEISWCRCMLVSVFKAPLHPKILPYLGSSDSCSNTPRHLEPGKGRKGGRRERRTVSNETVTSVT